VLGVGTSLLTYWLTRKLFGSQRLALGAVLLTHVVPMFIAGSVMMTIDPPFYFCWAAATCCAVLAIRDGKKWAWMLMGIAIGIGFLAKYAAFLWLVGLGVLFIVDRDSRRWIKTPWPWMAIVIALLFTTPVIMWNARHGWVSARHVGKQTGTSGQAAFQLKNVAEFLGGQFGAMGPPLFILMIAAVWYAWRNARRGAGEHPWQQRVPARDGTAVLRPRLGDQLSRQGPGELAGAGVLHPDHSDRVLPRDAVEATRHVAAVARILLGGGGARFDGHAAGAQLRLVVPGHRTDQSVHRQPQKTAPSPQDRPNGAAARVARELGAAIDAQLATLSPGAVVMCQDYMTTGATAFYVSGQPKTYYVGS
jgi:hypothetical protein